MIRRFLAALMLIVACAGIAPAADAPLASGARLPQTITVAQRTSTPLAPMGLALVLAIGDVTGGQVLARVTTSDGVNVLGPQSMRPGDVAPFAASGARLTLKLDELDNALVGDDRATFTVAAAAMLSETEKIERLLAAIEALPAARFVRNGKDYSPQEAVAHLRRKWKAATGQADDARRFIDELASTSSLSGKPYEIRYADGRTATVREFLVTELAQLDAR
jgi:hypothetical protein